jgi:uncharacterized protein
MVLGQKYCGDKAMQEMLRKLGTPRTLHEVYGLFYGSIAAPRLVQPSDCLDLVLGKEDKKPFESQKDAKHVLGNITSLWNLIAQWKPEKRKNIYPETKYPDTLDGLKQNTRDNISFIEYFIKGLDAGGLQKTDVVVSDALKNLAAANALQKKLFEALERDTTVKEKDIAGLRRQVAQLKDVMLDSIARINVGLREARKSAQTAGGNAPGSDSPEKKVDRNDPCPCGSGKKYKKCCAGRE